jgi:hypothetical protein
MISKAHLCPDTLPTPKIAPEHTLSSLELYSIPINERGNILPIVDLNNRVLLAFSAELQPVVFQFSDCIDCMPVAYRVRSGIN